MLAHAYITTPVDVSEIIKSFKDVPLDSFVSKAASKAFKDIINNDKLSISRVHSLLDRKTTDNAQNLRLSEFATNESNAKPTH